jgi:hypothetical protein
MQLLRQIKKFRRLAAKRFSGKAAALHFLNRRLAELARGRGDIGRIADMEIDRQNKRLAFVMVRDGVPTTMAINGYRFVREGRSTFLSWAALSCEGPDGRRYRELFTGVDRLEIAKRYLTMLELVL